MVGRKNKINRNSMLYSEQDFLFDVDIAKDYIEQDVNQAILLFQVDRTKTLVKNIYGETENEEDVRYKEPVELNVLYTISDTQNKSYDDKHKTGRYSLVGNLTFTILLKTMEEMGVDIKYGDFIGVQVTPELMLYFEVSNDGRVNYDNTHTRFGYKSMYRTIECTPVDKKVFNGI